MNKAMELLRGLVSEIERQTCEHEETHRGGAIWEICDSCGAKWADDEGGKPEFEWPESVEKAREFLAAHPAVEQAGGDERAAFFKHLIGRHPANETEIVRVLEHNYSAWKAWQARAALAQPSPTIATAPTYQFHSREIGESDWAPCDFSWYLYCSKSPEMDTRVVEVTAQPSPKSGYYSDQEWINAGCPPEQPSPVQAEQAEAERPEVVAYRTVGRHAKHQHPHFALNYYKQNAEDQAAHWRERGCEVSEDELMTVAQHERITAQLHDALDESDGDRWKLRSERDAALAEVERLRQFERICEGLPQDAIDGGWTVQGIRGYAKRLEDQLKVALARVAELERKLRDEENAHTTTIEQRDNAEHWADQLAKAIAERFGVDIGEHSNLNCPWNEALVWMQQPPAQAQHSVPGKYDDVLLPFSKLMEHELHANAGKGDRPGWLQMDRKTALLEIYYHLGKLQKATRDNDPAGIVEYAADVANMSMMLVDVCGLLAAAPAQGGE
ncbi:TPA: hypothetical protein L4F66_004277 [Pseudomonas aeruginosa]|nr:hypothetical protein [Pseudomonas aeruginosa]